MPERYVLMGYLTHNAGSLHVYERHYDKLDYKWDPRDYKNQVGILLTGDEPFPRIIDP